MKNFLIAIGIIALVLLVGYLIGHWLWFELQKEIVIQTAEDIKNGE